MLADTARTHARRLLWLQVGDETLERLRVLGGYDDDVAHDGQTAPPSATEPGPTDTFAHQGPS